jgi:hypothetical protein
MRSRTTVCFYNKIKSLLTKDEFSTIEEEIMYASNESLEAFWNILIAGYSVNFAKINYRKLYEYLRNKPLEYSEALTTYATYPGLDSGIYVTKTKWFELN